MLNFFCVKRKSGENPARARRREAQKGAFSLPDAANQGQAIDFFEKARKSGAAVGIFFTI